MAEAKEDANGCWEMESGNKIRPASGPKGYWQRLLDRAIERSKQGYISPFYLAVLYSQVGQNDRAFEMLEKAYQEHGSLMSGIQVAPRIDPLRSDPRFTDFLRRMKFPKT